MFKLLGYDQTRQMCPIIFLLVAFGLLNDHSDDADNPRRTKHNATKTHLSFPFVFFELYRKLNWVSQKRESQFPQFPQTDDNCWKHKQRATDEKPDLESRVLAVNLESTDQLRAPCFSFADFGSTCVCQSLSSLWQRSVSSRHKSIRLTWRVLCVFSDQSGNMWE